PPATSCRLKPIMTTIKLAATVALFGAACVLAVSLTAQEASVSETAKLTKMAARFAPTQISADLSRLSQADRQVLAKLVQASKIIDALFLRQAWAGNE